ncbi:MAG: DUF624 domain-containing protein [Oscillospiraceae bacterium]|nr:DUF624 domain-containing protein [Oscillospiraceae bacterium]
MGIFRKDYESAGSGIAKNSGKKGIKLFFEILGVRFWKIIEVNLLYSLFYLPLLFAFTFFAYVNNKNIALILGGIMIAVFLVLWGPATSGVFKIMKNFAQDKHSFIMSDFTQTFKSNFKNACIIGVVDILLLSSIIAGMWVYPALAEQTGSKIMYVFLAVSLSVGVTFIMMNFYMFPMLVSTDLSLKNIFKNSFALMFVELKRNVLTLLIIGGIVAVMLFLILFVNFAFIYILPFFPFAFNTFLICFRSYPVIQKYVINPYYEEKGEVNPELEGNTSSEETLFEDKGGSEKPIESRKKKKGKTVS